MKTQKPNIILYLTFIILFFAIGFFAWVFLGNTHSITRYANEPSSKSPFSINQTTRFNKPEITNKKVVVPSEPLTVPILMYHHVGPLPEMPGPIRRGLTVSPQDFEEQVEWLKSEGYTSITLREVYEASLGKFSLPAKPIVFTFDDGYLDVFTYALPVLLKHNYSGSFAIITDFVGSGEYASWGEIRKAHDLGMEIVSHTATHFDGFNPKYSASYIYQDLFKSKESIKSNLGIDTQILIYPYGHHTPEYIKQAQDLGFVMALTVKFGDKVNPQDLMRVPRIRVHGEGDFKKFKKNLTHQKTS